MAKDSFMVTEGDRSGVETPDAMEKARLRAWAAQHRLEFMLAHWSLSTREEIMSELVDAATTLQSAILLASKP